MKIKISKTNKYLEAVSMASLEQIMVVVLDPFIDIVFKRQYKSPIDKKRRLWAKWKCNFY
jgi:hypothetical protein